MCLWVCDNLRMPCSFNLQIKYPLYSAHSSARGYKIPLATGCHAERNKPPFRPIWLCDTGFHRLCLCLYLYPFTEVMHRILRSFLSADTPDCIHSPLPAQDRNPPDLFLQYTINARKQQANTVKKAKKDFNPESFLCNKSPLIGHKYIQSGPFAYKIKWKRVKLQLLQGHRWCWCRSAEIHSHAGFLRSSRCG